MDDNTYLSKAMVLPSCLWAGASSSSGSSSDPLNLSSLLLTLRRYSSLWVVSASPLLSFFTCVSHMTNLSTNTVAHKKQHSVMQHTIHPKLISFRHMSSNSSDAQQPRGRAICSITVAGNQADWQHMMQRLWHKMPQTKDSHCQERCPVST